MTMGWTNSGVFFF